MAIASQKRQALDRNSLRVGDRVGFKDRQGQERFGQVVKLNPKSASVQVDALRWRVGYALLLPVIDGALGDATYALPGQWVAITGEETSPFDTDGEDDSEVT